jgi:predicted MPP superfamily phosphohydrolase
MNHLERGEKFIFNCILRVSDLFSIGFFLNRLDFIKKKSKLIRRVLILLKIHLIFRLLYLVQILDYARRISVSNNINFKRKIRQ